MTFKILNQYKLINGVSDSSNGPINPFSQIDSEQRVVKFLKTLGWTDITKKDVIFADQIHRDGVHICQKGDSGSIRLGVDALVTNHKGQILVVKTADCLPILIYDPVQKVVAAIHAGRGSLTLNIISKAINKMVKNYGTEAKNLKVAIGPHIRKCHYFLKPKRIEELSKTKWAKYFEKRDITLTSRHENTAQSPQRGDRPQVSTSLSPPQLRRCWRGTLPARSANGFLSQEVRYKIYFDLTAAAMDELINSGVLKENIEDSGICTYEQYQKYYSARKKEENPEIYKEKLPCFASIIGMRR